MTRGGVTVVVQLAMPSDAEGCAVVVIGADHMREIVADGLRIVTAVKLADHVRARLDRGDDIAAIRLALENGEAPA